MREAGSSLLQTFKFLLDFLPLLPSVTDCNLGVYIDPNPFSHQLLFVLLFTAAAIAKGNEFFRCGSLLNKGKGKIIRIVSATYSCDQIHD